MSRAHPFNPQQVDAMKRRLAGESKKNRLSPLNCPHCNGEPEWVGPGWIEQTNNGSIVSCPLCNDDGAYPRPLR